MLGPRSTERVAYGNRCPQDCGVLTDLAINPTDMAPSEVVEAAMAAEEAGFDGVWTYDHLSGVSMGGTSIPEIWTLLGAIGAVTRRVNVGPLVANVTTRHPAVLAIAAATLQELTGGRAMLGLGAGAGPGSPYALEFEMVGIEARPAATRREMVVDTINVIRGLWRGEPDVTGRHHGLTGAVGFIRPDPLPPIIVGANGPKMSALAGRSADGVNIHTYEPELDSLIEVARAAATGRNTMVTVEAVLGDEWLQPDHPSRKRMIDLGVDRLVLAWTGDQGTQAIARAGKLAQLG